MIHEENTNLYLADEGKIFRRKADNFTMGEGIDLGDNDSIDNYIEDNMTEEELKAKAEEEEKRKVQVQTLKVQAFRHRVKSNE